MSTEELLREIELVKLKSIHGELGVLEAAITIMELQSTLINKLLQANSSTIVNKAA